jgi:hypothetical protein
VGDKMEKNEMGGLCSANGEGEASTGIWWGNLKERGHWGDSSLDGRIILRWIFRKWDVGYGMEWVGSGWRQMAGTCVCGNEPSGSIKCEELLD